MPNRVVLFFTTLGVLAAITVSVSFWAKGYIINRQSKRVEKTGMILAKSLPDGARIFLDGKLVSATNTTLPNLKPGKHHLKIEKEGFSPWEKEIEVRAEYVTSIEALLVPLTPKLTPLTKTGAFAPALSHDGTKIAYLSKSAKTPGVYLLPLTGTPLLDIIRGPERLLLADEPDASFSAGNRIFWSPDGEELLLEVNPQGFYLFPRDQGVEPQYEATSSATPTLERWQSEEKKRSLNLEKRDLSQETKMRAKDPESLWSPDGKRFLYREEGQELVEYYVYDISEPLGVGEKEKYVTLKVRRDEEPHVFWHTSSRHLILSRKGTVSLIEIDGGNETQVFSGNLAASEVFPTPDGKNLIILTSFTEEAEPNLYAISLR